MGAEKHSVDAQRRDDLVGDRPDQRVRPRGDTARYDHLHILGFQRLHELGDRNRVGEDGDARRLLAFQQMLREHVGRGAASYGDHIAGGHILHRFTCDGVLETNVHLRLYREQRLAEQCAGADGTAMHAFQQTFVREIGDVTSNGHRGNAELLRQRRDAHCAARTQTAQYQMLTL